MSDWLASSLADRDVCRRRTTSTTLRNKGPRTGREVNKLSRPPLSVGRNELISTFFVPTRLQRTVFRLRRHFGDPSSQQPEFLFSYSAFLRFYLSTAFFCWLLGTSERIHLYFFYRWKTHLTPDWKPSWQRQQKEREKGKTNLEESFRHHRLARPFLLFAAVQSSHISCQRQAYTFPL